jgi:Tfp pilus assembly protein PilF
MDTVGWVYHRSGDTDRAVSYLERAVAATTDIPPLNYHLGMAYLAAGNRVGARQELEKATRSADADFTGIEEAREALATLEDG